MTNKFLTIFSPPTRSRVRSSQTT